MRKRSVRKAVNLPLVRRFAHRRGNTAPLRPWEQQLRERVQDRTPERRLWAATLAESLRIIYTGRDPVDVLRELAWIEAPIRGPLQCFETIAEVLDLSPDAIRRDVRADVSAGRIAAVLPHVG